MRKKNKKIIHHCISAEKKNLKKPKPLEYAQVSVVKWVMLNSKKCPVSPSPPAWGQNARTQHCEAGFSSSSIANI